MEATWPPLPPSTQPSTHWWQLGRPGIQEFEERCIRSLSSCIWSRMGRLSPQAMLRSPSMIRAPSSCGDPHRSASFPRAATLRGYCQPSPIPSGPSSLNIKRPGHLSPKHPPFFGVLSSPEGKSISTFSKAQDHGPSQEKPKACPSTARPMPGQGHGWGQSD